MPLTNPGSITNSSSRSFSNTLGAIALINYNILVNADESSANDIRISSINNNNKYKNKKVCKCGCKKHYRY